MGLAAVNRWPHLTAFTDRQAMIEEFDLDQDGEISEAEFVSTLKLVLH